MWEPLRGLLLFTQGYLRMNKSKTVTTNKESFSFLKYSAVTLVAIIISMSGFWMSYGKDLVSRSEARLMINQGLQKIETEIEFIKERIRALDENISRQEAEFRSILKENTGSVNQLKIEITSLTKIIEGLSEKLNSN